MSKEAGGIISALLSILPKDMREFIGVYIMIFAPMAIIYGVTYLPKILEGMSQPTEKCWELKTIESEIYKINTCTGETELFKTITKEIPISPKPAKDQETHNKSLESDGAESSAAPQL